MAPSGPRKPATPPERSGRAWVRRALPSALVALLLAAACATLWQPTPGGPFRLTYYYVAEEPRSTARRDWPVYARDCRRVLAHAARDFHHALSLEGTGILRDGRMLNFDSRCDCARPGHGGSRVCYREVDRTAYPWGQGAPAPDDAGPWPLHPFRSVAVDPAVIPLGTWLYVPELAGRPGPEGRLLDGCLRAEDTGRLIRGRRLDLFTGRASWARWLHRAYGLREVRVEAARGRCPT